MTKAHGGIRESAIEASVTTYGKTLGILPRKLNFGEGWPDRMYLRKGQIIFIEFKQLGEIPTPLQLYVHGLLRLQGFQVYVVDTVEYGKSILGEFHGKSNNVAEVR